MYRLSILCLALAATSQAFFFGSSGCGCRPSCPPPPPPPVCAPAPSCGGCGAAYPQQAPVQQITYVQAQPEVQLQTVQAQPVQAQPAQAQNQVYVNPSQSLDGQIAQEIQFAEAEAKGRVKRDDGESFDPKCNSEILRDIILKNIHSSTATAKRQIQAAAAEELGGRVDAICSTGTFSYIVNTEVYCETEKNGVTCFVFKQSE